MQSLHEKYWPTFLAIARVAANEQRSSEGQADHRSARSNLRLDVMSVKS
jgi:hypothetical protein